ncbi:hypothetical protein C6341_g20841 [Phytophthora cactorum]|nr:hypothetical protein C6341_g20841 [Phytophthora cactorum]
MMDTTLSKDCSARSAHARYHEGSSLTDIGFSSFKCRREGDTGKYNKLSAPGTRLDKSGDTRYHRLDDSGDDRPWTTASTYIRQRAAGRGRARRFFSRQLCT